MRIRRSTPSRTDVVPSADQSGGVATVAAAIGDIEGEMVDADAVVDEKVSAADALEDADSGQGLDLPADGEPTGRSRARRRARWSRILAFAVIPGFAIVLAAAAGVLRYFEMSAQTADVARIEAVQAAKESTVELLSYKPATVEQDLNKARDLLTGNFRDAYTSLINDVVIPGAKQKQVTSVATVPAASTVSATVNQAVVLVFIDQSITMGADAPTNTASSVRVTLDKLNDRWVISEFDPV